MAVAARGKRLQRQSKEARRGARGWRSEASSSHLDHWVKSQAPQRRRRGAAPPRGARAEGRAWALMGRAVTKVYDRTACFRPALGTVCIDSRVSTSSPVQPAGTLSVLCRDKYQSRCYLFWSQRCNRNGGWSRFTYKKRASLCGLVDMIPELFFGWLPMWRAFFGCSCQTKPVDSPSFVKEFGSGSQSSCETTKT